MILTVIHSLLYHKMTKEKSYLEVYITLSLVEEPCSKAVGNLKIDFFNFYFFN